MGLLFITVPILTLLRVIVGKQARHEAQPSIQLPSIDP
jgi:hypothetical protein